MTGNQVIGTRKVSGLYVRPYEGNERIKLPAAYTRAGVPINRAHILTPEMARKWPHLECVAPKLVPPQNAKIGLLIGYNCARLLIPREVIAPSNNIGPYAQRTDLGWGIVGTISQNDQEVKICHRIVCSQWQNQTKEVFTEDDVISDMLPSSKYSYNDVLFLKQVATGIHQEKDGHYCIPLPMKEPIPQLPNNKAQAMSRLQHLKRKMCKDNKLRKDYTEFMTDVINKGYAEEVQAPDDGEGNVWYIPHHGVYNPNKPKLRVVFDCSARYQSFCLNDLLLPGPDLTNTLLGVLCRFRKESIAITCDIEKMFYQFRVHEHQRNYLRFLWWKDGDLSQYPSTYRMTVHLFGASSSPGCSNFGLKRVANDGAEEFGKKAREFVSNDFYVDDGLTSVSSTEEAIQLIHDTRNMCAAGGLKLHKFTSNSPEVLLSIPQEDRAIGLQNYELNMKNEDLVERTLGLQWNIDLDVFQFKVTPKNKPDTRRGILSMVSQVYDPLGFLAPYILKGKQILQDMCHRRLDWDEKLPTEIEPKWKRWLQELSQLKDISIPRCLKPVSFGDFKAVQLHHFSDASKESYGQCSYIRVVNHQNEVHCSLVMAKSRVTPLKVLTIPRLELTAALLSVNVGRVLKSELKFEKVEEFYYTDSKVVLGYINNEAKRFHVFVANRVQQIRNYTEPQQWRHVETTANPADLASRGASPEKLMKDEMWFKGPRFLWNLEIPETVETACIEEGDPEIKTTFSTETERAFSLIDQISTFSSWFKARRAIANSIHYIQKLRQSLLRKTRSQPKVPLTTEHFQQAELLIVKEVQSKAFGKEISKLQKDEQLPKKSSLYQLAPFLDDKGVLRVGGRLRGSYLNDREKHPVVLPKDSHISKLIVRHYHETNSHQGRGITTNAVRSAGYWLIGINHLVRHYIHKCVHCRRWRGATAEQIMADLPPDRTETAAPFTFCAVDYFGPFRIKIRRSEVQRYGVLFTCMASRAIHLEVAPSLETDAFINALRRFIAIRGPIRTLRCDRGTNFVGAKNELERAATDIKLTEFMQRNDADIEFKMNFPSSSHMGGVWERQIRTVRQVLSPILARCGSQLDDDSLRTVFYEVMAIVNSRPLSVANINDVNTEIPLTPNQLLTMKSKVVLPPPGEFQHADLYCRKQWRRVQYILNQFWSRWKSEYLQTLQGRSKWNKPHYDMHKGDIVIVKNEDAPRNEWPLAIVEEVFYSTDGHVRKVKLKIGNRGSSKPTYLERPIHKLIVLIKNSADEEPNH